MRMKNLSTRLAAAAVALGAGTLLAACGDNLKDDTGDDDPDAASIDATMIDAMPIDGPPTPQATIAGTIAVSEVSVTTPGALLAPPNGPAGLRGGGVSIEFSDLTMNGGEMIFGTSPVNGCVVVRHDPDNLPNPGLDLGVVKISGDGLLKPMPSTAAGSPADGCAYSNGAYSCVYLADSALAGAVGDGNPGTKTYSYVGEDFTGFDAVGMYLVTTGWAAGNNAIPNTATPPHPIIGQGGAGAGMGTLVVPARTGMTNETVATGIGYTLLAGQAPVPTLGGAIDNDFLGGSDTEVTIEMAASMGFPAINETIDVQGEGFALDTAASTGTFGEAGYVPAKLNAHEFPTAVPTGGADTDVFAQFTCTPGTSCGDDGSELVEAMILSGRTTTQTIPKGVPDYYMPANLPTETYTTFRCGFIGGNTVNLTKEFIAAVLSVDPTRIETRVFRFSGKIISGDPVVNSINVLVGHGLVGHATPE